MARKRADIVADNKSFFTGWIVVSFVWVWASMCICVIYPVVESAGALKHVSRGLWMDAMSLLGRGKSKKRGVYGTA